MSNLDPNRGLMPSLLDRLIDPESGGTEHRRGYDLRQALDAVRRDVDVLEVGFLDHPEIPSAGASPDRLVGLEGLIECKCPNTGTHIDTLLSETVPQKYMLQMQFQMAVTGRDWCDFVSFDPRLPEEMSLFVARVPRDVSLILEIESEVTTFLRELDAKVARLTERYARAA